MLNSVMCKSNLKMPTDKDFRSHLSGFHGLSKYIKSKLIDKKRGRTLLFCYRFWFFWVTDFTTYNRVQITSPPYNLTCHYCGATHAPQYELYFTEDFSWSSDLTLNVFMKTFSFHNPTEVIFYQVLCREPPASVKPHQCQMGAEGGWRIRAVLGITNHQQSQSVQNVQSLQLLTRKGSL